MKTSETIDLLKKHAKMNSFWGLGIKLIIQHPTHRNVARLVKQLREQDKDEPGAMKEILGEAYEKIINP